MIIYLPFLSIAQETHMEIMSTTSDTSVPPSGYWCHCSVSLKVTAGSKQTSKQLEI